MPLYDFENGEFVFPSPMYTLRISMVSRDRWGRLFGRALLQTGDGNAYLAMDHGDLLSSHFRSRLATQAAQRNSGDIITMENFILDAVLALKDDPIFAPANDAPSFLTLPDFINSVPPPRPQVVEALVERGALYILASKPKVGKTILLFNLALNVATGDAWLGRAVAQGVVYMLQLEDSPRTLKRRLERMTGGQLPLNFYIRNEPFRLSSSNYDATVRAFHNATLIICDPIIQASDVRDWNAQSEVRDTYELWRRLSRDTDAAVILAAHHRKSLGDFGDQMAGSIQAQASVDGIIELYRDDSLERTERKMAFTGRDWADREDEVIRLDPETLTFRSMGTYREIREMDRQGKLQTKIAQVLAVLPATPPGLTYEEIEQQTGIGRRQIRDVLQTLGDQVAESNRTFGRSKKVGFWRVSLESVSGQESR